MYIFDMNHLGKKGKIFKTSHNILVLILFLTASPSKMVGNLKTFDSVPTGLTGIS